MPTAGFVAYTYWVNENDSAAMARDEPDAVTGSGGRLYRASKQPRPTPAGAPARAGGDIKASGSSTLDNGSPAGEPTKERDK